MGGIKKCCVIKKAQRKKKWLPSDLHFGAHSYALWNIRENHQCNIPELPKTKRYPLLQRKFADYI